MSSPRQVDPRAQGDGWLQPRLYANGGEASAYPSEHNKGGLHALPVACRQPPISHAYLARLGVRNQVCEPLHGTTDGGAPTGGEACSPLCGRDHRLMVCTTRGPPARCTSSATMTVTSPATSTQARAPMEQCSSLVTAWSAGNPSSRRLWHCQAAKQSTLPPQLQRHKLYGCPGCSGSFLAERLMWWS